MARNTRKRRKAKTESKDLIHFLSRVSTSIRENGWVSSKEARDQNVVSTAQTVKNWLDIEDLARRGKITTGRLEGENIPPVTEQDITDAENAIVTTIMTTERAAEENNYRLQTNTYLQSLYMIAQRRTYLPKEIGLAASMMHYARKIWDSDRRREEEAQAREAAGLRPSQHLGEVGEHVEVTVTLASMRSMQSGYGTKTLCKWETPAGDKLAWFATNPPDNLAVGRNYTVRGLIKRHSTYKGECETVISNCKVQSLQLSLI